MKNNNVPIEPVSTATGTQMCFYREVNTVQGFKDVTSLTMHIKDATVTGELSNYPAEKDSKIGPFAGTVGEVDDTSMERTASVWWEATGEGVTNKEELTVKFGEGTARIGFGEMVLGANGIYMYKDASKVDYSLELSDISCEMLFEMVAVESYVKANIGYLAKDVATMGGTWRVLSTDVDTEKNTVEVSYEDGHDAKKETFSYTREGNVVEIVKE